MFGNAKLIGSGNIDFSFLAFALVSARRLEKVQGDELPEMLMGAFSRAQARLVEDNLREIDMFEILLTINLNFGYREIIWIFNIRI